MQNIVSKIWMQKKIIFFVAFFISISLFYFGVGKIEIANARMACGPNGECDPGQVCQGAMCIKAPIVDQAVSTVSKTWCTNSWNWWKSIIAGIVDLILWIPKEFASIAGKLSGSAISEVSNWSITNGNSKDGAAMAFTAGWITVRDLANMLIVLGFVIVGIATALRIQEYAATKFLKKLIIVALLINFSGLFCGLLIDGSKITMSYFLGGDNGAMGSNFVDNLTKTSNGILCKDIGPAGVEGNLWDYTMHSVEFLFIFLAVAFAFLYLALVLIARYAILGILFMLSPLAFVFYAFPFPKAKNIWDEWWSHFLKWAFVGVQISFFLWLAASILQNFEKTYGNLYPTSNPDGTFFYILVVLMVIFVGIKISLKSSGLAAAAAVGIAGYAMMGAGKVAGGVANKTGLSRVGNSIKNTGGKALERLGFRQAGTTAGNASKEMEARQKTVANLSSDQQAKLATRRGPGKDTARNRIAAIKNLVKSGDMDKIGDVNAQHRALAEVEGYEKSRGISSNIRKDAEEKNYQLAGFSTKKVNNALLASGINPKTATATQETAAAQRARQNQLITNLPKMSSNDLAGINPNDISADLVTNHMSPAMIDKLQVAPNQHLKDNLRLLVDLPNGGAGALRTAYNNAPTNAEAAKIMKKIEAIQRLP